MNGEHESDPVPITNIKAAYLFSLHEIKCIDCFLCLHKLLIAEVALLSQYIGQCHLVLRHTRECEPSRLACELILV